MANVKMNGVNPWVNGAMTSPTPHSDVTSDEAPPPGDGGGAEFVGPSCGHHGPYTFFKAVRVPYDPAGDPGGDVKPIRRCRLLALGDFFLVKLWSHQEIISIGELQLLWEDKLSAQPLASVKLYFLPENTPDGRHEEHGQVKHSPPPPHWPPWPTTANSIYRPILNIFAIMRQ